MARRNILGLTFGLLSMAVALTTLGGVSSVEAKTKAQCNATEQACFGRCAKRYGDTTKGPGQQNQATLNCQVRTCHHQWKDCIKNASDAEAPRPQGVVDTGPPPRNPATGGKAPSAGGVKDTGGRPRRPNDVRPFPGAGGSQR